MDLTVNDAMSKHVSDNLLEHFVVFELHVVEYVNMLFGWNLHQSEYILVKNMHSSSALWVKTYSFVEEH